MTNPDYGKALENFLKSPIKCLKCKQGASNFTVNFDELKQEYYSKWGNYCSGGCVMTDVDNENFDEHIVSYPISLNTHNFEP